MNAPLSDEKFMVVTPEQYKAGYMEFHGRYTVRCRFCLLKRLPDGNYIVWVPNDTMNRLRAEVMNEPGYIP